MHDTLLPLIFAVLSVAGAIRCNGNKFQRIIRRYPKCLQKGYISQIGCESKRDRKEIPHGNYMAKCLKADKFLVKCGYQCKIGSSELRRKTNDEHMPGMPAEVGVHYAEVGVHYAEVDVHYPLNRPLRVGDVLNATGYYNDDTTDKFSFNIMGDGLGTGSDFFLLHIDFRPSYIVPIVMNSKAGAYNWDPEVHPTFAYGEGYKKQEEFTVEIIVLKTSYKVSYNGFMFSETFPQRYDIADANAVMLSGGSNGFRWISIQLPELDTK